jgi:hypothetical protein
MTEHRRQDILHPVIGKPDASASAHHRLAANPVLVLSQTQSIGDFQRHFRSRWRR